MSSIVAVRDKFRDTALNLSTIETFSFDDLDLALNQINNNYRLFHLSVPEESTITDFNKPYQNWPIQCWLFDIDDQSTPESRIELWEGLETKMNEFMSKLLELPAEIRLSPTNAIIIQRGHYQHTDSLIGVRYAFSIDIFECR